MPGHRQRPAHRDAPSQPRLFRHHAHAAAARPRLHRSRHRIFAASGHSQSNRRRALLVQPKSPWQTHRQFARHVSAQSGRRGSRRKIHRAQRSQRRRNVPAARAKSRRQRHAHSPLAGESRIVGSRRSRQISGARFHPAHLQYRQHGHHRRQLRSPAARPLKIRSRLRGLRTAPGSHRNLRRNGLHRSGTDARNRNPHVVGSESERHPEAGSASRNEPRADWSWDRPGCIARTRPPDHRAALQHQRFKSAGLRRRRNHPHSHGRCRMLHSSPPRHKSGSNGGPPLRMTSCKAQLYPRTIPQVSRLGILCRVKAPALTIYPANGQEMASWRGSSVRKVLFVLPVSLFIFFSAARPAYPQISNASANILVDDDKVQCPTAQFTTIQAAVNAANSGDVIRVCAGTYPEQVTISTPLTLRADNGVVVIPSGMTQNSTGASGGGSIAAIFVVQGVQGVDIDGFIVDGSNNGLIGCSPQLIGIDYENSSGHIRHNAVRHMNLGSALPGCQSGDGIEVETGSGPTPNIAQNGIQIGFGAAGKITNNTVSDNIYSICSSSASCPTNATGILVFQSDGVAVRNNSLATNQIGVFIGGDNSVVASNTISNSVALIGVTLVGNDNSSVRNTLTHADQAAIYIQGNGNRATGNDITDAAIGVLKISGSTGSTIANNVFHATLITIQDPAPTRPIGVSPVR